MNANLPVSLEVRQALAEGGPVVSLESTVIAQGLPWPTNLETARRVERAVRASGGVPATIAVLDGEIRIGLTEAELERVARAAEPRSTSGAFAKANRRDLSTIVAQGKSAATTVSATLWIAHRFKINPCVMATGGLGGVHRDAATSFDVSTDLDELARADGAVVVCSGFKSILDLPATLEALETRGVAVIGYRTDELPAFTSVSSGLSLEHHLESPQEIASLVQAQRALGLPGAVVLAQPVPASEALDRDIMEAALEAGLQDARRRQISGKALTPFLLDAIRVATSGASLRANCALLEANARLAAEVAVALSKTEP